MTTPLYVAPQAAGLPSTPYLTVAEYLASPMAIDPGQLMMNGGPQQQEDVLATQISRASSWMDRFVHYTLGATRDTETARARIQRDGCVVVNTRGVPILEIDSFMVGPRPSLMGAIDPGAAADAWIEDNTIRMPAYLSTGRDGVVWGIGLGMRVYCQWTYVNGYCNTALAAAATAGAATISVTNALGIYPGTTLTVYDAGTTEEILVDASYAGGTEIPLVSPLQSSHEQTISVSAMPPVLKQAAVHATNGYIRARGADTLSMDTLEMSHVGGEPGQDDLVEAETLLATFVLPAF